MFGRRPAPDARLQASALEQAAPVHQFVRIEYQRRGAQHVHGFYPVQTLVKNFWKSSDVTMVRGELCPPILV